MKRALLAIAFVVAARAHADPLREHLELPNQSLTDGNKVQFTPLTIQNSRAERDTRPIMLGGGIVVLAAIFWWNRKRRERFDRSDVPRASRATTESREDTDDLQAAARGDNKDPES
jgi:hypothetical protein